MPRARLLLPALAAALLVAGSVAAQAPKAEPKKQKWQKEPGPITGRWKVTCPSLGGMIITVTAEGDKATGLVAEPGQGAGYGYVKGETIFKVAADGFGEWVGQARWRSAAQPERWDPIRLVASADRLDATQATDACFRAMPRQ